MNNKTLGTIEIRGGEFCRPDCPRFEPGLCKESEYVGSERICLDIWVECENLSLCTELYKTIKQEGTPLI